MLGVPCHLSPITCLPHDAILVEIEQSGGINIDADVDRRASRPRVFAVPLAASVEDRLPGSQPVCNHAQRAALHGEERRVEHVGNRRRVVGVSLVDAVNAVVEIQIEATGCIDDSTEKSPST